MLLSPKQREFVLKAKHRWNFKGGATRSGKTYLDFKWIIPIRIRERIGKEGLVVLLGVTKSTIERNVLEPMRNIYGSELVGTISSDNTVMLFGERCYALGAEKITQVSKIRGASIKYCYGDEVADWSEEVFELLKSRLDKDYSCFDGTFNPQYPGHWLKAFLDSDADVFSQTYTLDDNPFIPESFKENLKREYEGTVYYDRYILGLWVLAEGLVYTFIDDYYGEDVDDPQEYYVSIDYGTMNPFSAGLWAVNGKVATRTHEYYYSGRAEQATMTDEEYCDAIDRLVDGKKIRFVVVDPSAASFITALQRRGYHVVPAKNEVEDGIRRVAVMLKNGNIKIHRRCVDAIREFGSYRWDSKATKDSVIKENDHAMDDIRYFCSTVMQSKVRMPDKHDDGVPSENRWIADYKKSVLGGNKNRKIYR